MHTNIIDLANRRAPQLDPRILDEDAVRRDTRPVVQRLRDNLYHLEDQLQEDSRKTHHQAYQLLALQQRAEQARLAYRLALACSKMTHPCEYIRVAEFDAFIRERQALATALGGQLRVLEFSSSVRVNYRSRSGHGKCWFFQRIPGGYRHTGVPTNPLAVEDWEDALPFRFTDRLPA